MEEIQKTFNGMGLQQEQPSFWTQVAESIKDLEKLYLIFVVVVDESG
jgi:hypothetical protein